MPLICHFVALRIHKACLASSALPPIIAIPLRSIAVEYTSQLPAVALPNEFGCYSSETLELHFLQPGRSRYNGVVRRRCTVGYVLLCCTAFAIDSRVVTVVSQSMQASVML